MPLQVIGELDEKKREALHASWVKVNRDFGSIFTSLLPGTMAKLDPPEGQSFLAGLEVKASPFSCYLHADELTQINADLSESPFHTQLVCQRCSPTAGPEVKANAMPSSVCSLWCCQASQF